MCYIVIGNSLISLYKYTDGDNVRLYDTSSSTLSPVATNNYDSFGNGGANEYSRLGYAGEYHDAETGFIYLRARYYDPAIGRFISEDPIHDGLNWYVYANNNPIKYIDPRGTEALSIISIGGLATVSILAVMIVYIVQNIDYGINDMTISLPEFELPKPLINPFPEHKSEIGIVSQPEQNNTPDIETHPEENGNTTPVIDVPITDPNSSNVTTSSSKLRIPSKLMDGDKVKTPETHKEEFRRGRNGTYRHISTGWVAEKARPNVQHGGPHWDMYPEKGSGHINVGFEGNIF